MTEEFNCRFHVCSITIANQWDIGQVAIDYETIPKFDGSLRSFRFTAGENINHYHLRGTGFTSGRVVFYYGGGRYTLSGTPRKLELF